MSDFANFDPIELIRRLVEQEVDFVIIELRKLITQEPPHPPHADES